MDARLWPLLAVLVWPAVARAFEVTHRLASGRRVTVIEIHLPQEQLQLFWKDDKQQPFKSFAAINRSLAASGRQLACGMNAGMFHSDLSPVGLCIINRKEFTPLNLKNGTGNFYLKPNGVLLLTTNGAQVLSSSRYPQVRGPVEFATQSGPLLLEQGRTHPAFRADSTSRYTRNGAGLANSDALFLAITEEPITLYEFALFFREVLRCTDALYLDGAISSVHLPAEGRSDAHSDLGPILGIVTKRP